MSDDTLRIACPSGSNRWDHLPQYRWWRKSIVGSVDHQKVVTSIVEDSGWSQRYTFMTMMSPGIAVLGLLLSSSAVVIGAMLISPLMSPIPGLGFSQTMFDFAEVQRSLTALAIGSAAAVIFTVVIVIASPLKATTGRNPRFCLPRRAEEPCRPSRGTGARARAADEAVARIAAVMAGVSAEQVTLDHDHRRVISTSTVLPGSSLASYRVLEQRASAASEGWDVAAMPPLGLMPLIRYADGSDALDNTARGTVLLSAWAARRWDVPALAAPGLPQTIDDTPTLTERQGLAIAALLQEKDVRSAPAAGPEFRLAASAGE